MKPRWLTPEEIADELHLPLKEVERMIEARELRAIELPSGVRRIDARFFQRFLRVHEVGFTPRFLDEPSLAGEGRR